MTNITSYRVWGAGVRWFHWLNVLCVLGLIAIGVVILNAKLLGVASDGKIVLKTLHVYIGYVFVVNLVVRFVGGFIGNRYSRWGAILPLGRDYFSQLRRYLTLIKSGERPVYLGHNPLGRIMVGLMLVLMTCQALTGLVLAGTDVYMPPLGGAIRESVALDKAQLDLVQPYSKENVDPKAFETMRAWRKPFITVHYWSFYTLLVLIVIHIMAVVLAEVRGREGLVSAMFSGYKTTSQSPEDGD